jgi:hypothetical protein
MNKIGYSVMAAVLAAGSMTFGACTSSDEEMQVKEQQAQQPEVEQQSVKDVLGEMGDNLAKIEFSQLAPLADALQQNDAWEARGLKPGTDEQQGQKKFIEKFRALLQHLLGGEDGLKWSVSNADQTLQLTSSALFELEGIGLKEDKEGNRRTYENELKVTKDDTVYTIKTKVVKNIGGRLSQLSLEGQRVLQVYKEDECILGIETDRLLVLGNSYAHVGKIHARGADIELGVKFTDEQTMVRSVSVAMQGNPMLSLNLTTDKDFDWNTVKETGLRFKTHVDANLMGRIFIVTDVADVLKFYKEGLALAAISVNGTTEENCKELCNSFNENVNTQLMMAGSVLGSVMVMPIKKDTLDSYRPGLLAVTSLSDGHPLAINDALALMGFSFQDIINMLMGKTPNDVDDEEEEEEYDVE